MDALENHRCIVVIIAIMIFPAPRSFISRDRGPTKKKKEKKKRKAPPTPPFSV